MQPITVHLHKSKALASIFACLIGFYEVGWDVAPVGCHCRDSQCTCSHSHLRSFHPHVLPMIGSDPINANRSNCLVSDKQGKTINLIDLERLQKEAKQYDVFVNSVDVDCASNL